MLIEGVTTKGRAIGPPSLGVFTGEWVRQYKVRISNDGKTWTDLSRAEGGSNPTMFTANQDRTTAATNTFGSEVEARYLRIYPQTYNQRISMRANLKCNSAKARADLFCRSVSYNKTAFLAGHTTPLTVGAEFKMEGFGQQHFQYSGRTDRSVNKAVPYGAGPKKMNGQTTMDIASLTDTTAIACGRAPTCYRHVESPSDRCGEGAYTGTRTSTTFKDLRRLEALEIPVYSRPRFRTRPTKLPDTSPRLVKCGTVAREIG